MLSSMWAQVLKRDVNLVRESRSGPLADMGGKGVGQRKCLRGRGLGERREREPTRVLGGGIYACLIRILEAVSGHGTGMSGGKLSYMHPKLAILLFQSFLFSQLFFGPCWLQ